MKRNLLLIALCAAFAATCFADEPPTPGRFYRLHFVVQEVDGNKIVNSREYDATASTESGGDCSIRTESHLMLSTGPSSMQGYLVDVKIDASRLRETSTGVSLQLRASLDTLAGEQEQDMTKNHGPVVRANNWSSPFLTPLRKPIVVFSSDDLTSKHKMQLVLTATPIN